MQITSLSFLFKKFNIIKNGININNTLKYNYMLSCLVVSYTQKALQKAKAKGRWVLKQL
jgi:hypothetical protein